LNISKDLNHSYCGVGETPKGMINHRIDDNISKVEMKLKIFVVVAVSFVYVMLYFTNVSSLFSSEETFSESDNVIQRRLLFESIPKPSGRMSRIRRSKFGMQIPLPVSYHDIECQLITDQIYVRNNIFGPVTQSNIECIPLLGTAKEWRTLLIQNFPKAFLKTHHQNIEQNNLIVRISEAKIFTGNNTVTLTEHSGIVIKNRRDLQIGRNSKSSKVTNRKVLALTISTTDSTNRFTPDTLYPYLFGDDKISMQSQFQACSAGQFMISPVFGGVVDILLSGPLSTYTPRDATFAAMDIFEKQYGITNLPDLVDSIMFCLPPGMASFAASAVTSHYRTIFNDENCARLSVVMHELAHNIGIGHSSKHGKRYDDLTGYMGRSQPQLEGPQKCYNAAQHWQLGWYESHRLDWQDEILAPRIVTLYSFVDIMFIQDPTGFVLINIADKVYLQLNSAKSFNAGTGDFKNMVTVVEGGIDNLVDGLDAVSHSRFEARNFNDDGNTLIIEVCGFLQDSVGLDLAILSIGLQDSMCALYNPHQNEIPSMAPSALLLPTVSQEVDGPSEKKMGSDSFNMDDLGISKYQKKIQVGGKRL
jgi:hypothetical protein